MREPTPGEVQTNWVAPWVVVARSKGGQDWWSAYCLACWAFVTDMHNDSAKHFSKVKWFDPSTRARALGRAQAPQPEAPVNPQAAP
eukprot:1534518-Lingulodinium_polyedra.AAC.1